jgi:hypothetical protein
VEEYCSLFLHDISHDVFTFGIEKKERGIVPFLQVGEALFPPNFDDYLEEEQQNSTSPFADQNSQPFYDSYESCSELETQDFQEQSFPTGPVYDDYESDLGESQVEEKEPEDQYSLYSKLVSEQPPPEVIEPTSFIHSPALIRDIRPHVNNCAAEEAACHQFSENCHSFYDLVNEYMEWHFPYALEPPYFISTPSCKEELKSVTVLLSRLHHLLMIIDIRKELLPRKLLEWLWWKSSFT